MKKINSNKNLKTINYQTMKGANMKRRGFTLLELVVVIIIVGILASIGLTQYTTVVEKGRASEAKAILGQIRTAQQMYYQENNAFTSTATDLSLDTADLNCTSGKYYFSYTVGATSATATRCMGTAGKQPGGPAGGYNATMAYDTGVITFSDPKYK